MDPAAITTIIVSPIAREAANIIAAIIPVKADGNTTCFTISNRVAPSANEASFVPFATALIASSDRDAIVGIIINPITIPGLIALKNCKSGIILCKSGVTTVNAKKPYTIVGIPANSSNIGFNIFRALFEAYSLKNTAHAKPIGIATNIAIAVTRNVPHISGNIPNLGSSKNGNHSFSVKKEYNDIF
ncbi:Uncharacterised protein [Streptococcus pneumoniae]|nr:Uncharacterised protein [Streptococcus pneumoniae]